MKPANALVRPISGADHAYLTDFGIARHVDVGATGLTKTGQTVGTVGYMAPEQIRGDASDGRADLYSLGCVFYQCLTGRRPFEHDSEVAVMFAHVNEERPRPSAVDPALAPFDEFISPRPGARAGGPLPDRRRARRGAGEDGHCRGRPDRRRRDRGGGHPARGRDQDRRHPAAAARGGAHRGPAAATAAAAPGRAD